MVMSSRHDGYVRQHGFKRLESLRECPREIAARLLSGVSALDQLHQSVLAEADQQRRLALGIVGSGEQHVHA